MPKAITRCKWAEGTSLDYIEYHDKEWGVPVFDDRVQFEFLILEGAQAGLSWSTILNKRDGYRKNFADFDPVKVARFTKKRVEKILLDPSIVRNRLKVESTVSNAKAFLAVQKEFGTFSDYIWEFVGGKPMQNRFKKDAQVPATSPESDALSNDLKKRGFRFVGSTIVYAHMQATGMVNDHVTGCFRYKPCAALGKKAGRKTG
ncbi:MAG: DNA-3-methyladenine glycosylase I [Gammaproteobacteria bacterium]|nr:DNA-3-methyladenine glycosylase I [Gammaproteobacteria bacterium]